MAKTPLTGPVFYDHTQPSLDLLNRFRQVAPSNRSSLRPEIESVVFDLGEQHGVCLFCQPLIRLFLSIFFSSFKALFSTMPFIYNWTIKH